MQETKGNELSKQVDKTNGQEKQKEKLGGLMDKPKS